MRRRCAGRAGLKTRGGIFAWLRVRYHATFMQNTSRVEAFINRLGNGFQKHWLGAIVTGLFVYSLLPFAAPVLMKVGLTGPAQLIYTPYKFVCHTLGFRSFWLFGPQPVYSRGDDPSGGGDFQVYSGINPAGFTGQLQARDFQGSEAMGYKTALCQRDIFIYFTMALNGLLFSFVRGRKRLLPWWLLIAIGVIPVGLDGFSQMLSQPPFNFIPFRESVWQLRALTGALFGFGMAWLVFPLLEETMKGGQ